MTAPTDKTIHERIAELREEEARQEVACLEAIKAIHQQPEQHSIPIPGQRSPGIIGRGPGAIEKVTPSGKHLGWYRAGQTAGLPGKKLPIEADLDAQREHYYAMLRASIPSEYLARQLGQRSGVSRAQSGLKPKILFLETKLIEQGVEKHHRAKLIARTLDCSIEYVHRVLRSHKSIT